MDLSRIKVGEIPNRTNAAIEILHGLDVKYELGKDSGAVFVGRVVASAMFYPANYGFIVNILADDGDPMDILVLNEYPIQAGTMIPCRLIGVLMTEDESGMDERLLAAPADKVDARYTDIKSYMDLPQATLNKIRNLFETYKILEPNKWVKVQDFKDINAAIEILEKTVKDYKARW